MKSCLNLIPYIVLGQNLNNGPKFRRQFLHSKNSEKP
jgi:hypothetical protein